MRRVTRNLILGLVIVAAGLLALGALPSHVASGDPYYVEATSAADADGPAVDGTALSERRFPYCVGALSAAAAGTEPARSGAYYEDPTPWAIKEQFTHTPFDEYEELAGRNAAAVDRSVDSPVGDVAFVTFDGVRYRLEIVRPGETE